MSDAKPLSALERLKLKHATPPTAAATLPAVVTPPVTQQPVTASNPGLSNLLSGAVMAQPAVQQPVQQQAPIQQQPVQQAPTIEQVLAQVDQPANLAAPVTRAPLPSLTNVDSNMAQMALLSMLGQTASYAQAFQEGVDAADEGTMIALSQPFARVVKGNWLVLKDKYEPTVYDEMPVGNRTYDAIYIGHRLSATGWAGEVGASGNKPPLFKFVVPPQVPNLDKPGTVMDMDKALFVELNKETLFIGSKIMFTKRDQRGKFDLIGRLTPGLHVLVWRPKTGFIVLCIEGFKSVEDTMTKFSEKGMIVGHTYSFDIVETKVVNKKGTVEEKNQEWINYSIVATPNVTPRANEFTSALRDISGRDPVKSYLEVTGFTTGSDFAGLTLDQIADTLDAYKQITG